MNIRQMQDRINEAYNGHWLAVYSMPSNQVCAIYNSMLKNGKFDKKRAKKPQGEKSYYRQMTIFDYI